VKNVLYELNSSEHVLKPCLNYCR